MNNIEIELVGVSVEIISKVRMLCMVSIGLSYLNIFLFCKNLFCVLDNLIFKKVFVVVYGYKSISLELLRREEI